MRTFLIEKTPDLQFESDSTATLKVNSLVLPDLVLNGTHILKFPIYLKPIHETSQIQNLELSCRLVPELIMAGVVLIGAFIDGDELVVAVNGNARLKENKDFARISFYERVRIISLPKIVSDKTLDSLSTQIKEMVATWPEPTKKKAPKRVKK